MKKNLASRSFFPFKKIPPVERTARIRKFLREIRGYYLKHGRSFAWRNTRDPYRIMVSEIMLQQTQTNRVRVKYDAFLSAFPDMAALARAPLHAVLAVWQGMGYNRRAKALKEAAMIIMERHCGRVPSSPEELDALPGIGPATAASIAAFAFNVPTVFIETNIRAVFIHFFLSNKTRVKDSELLPLVEQTLDRKNPRLWYYALMDYGVMLKKERPELHRKSAHYKKQSRFLGSNRQARGRIVALLAVHRTASVRELREWSGLEKEKVEKSLKALLKEGMVAASGKRYRLP